MLINFSKDLFIFVCMNLLLAYLHAMCMLGALGGQRRALGPPELELQTEPACGHWELDLRPLNSRSARN